MRVKELIEILSKEDPEEHIFIYDLVYGVQSVGGVYRRRDGALYIDTKEVR